MRESYVIVPNQKDHETPGGSLFLNVHLSIHLPGSSILSMANSCQQVAGFSL